MSGYAELAERLHNRGIESYLQNPELLVVSKKNPAMPDSNCFWVTRKNGGWYLGTWLPAIYQIPASADVCEICATVLNSASNAIYTVDDALAQRLRLDRLTEAQIDALGLGEEQSDM